MLSSAVGPAVLLGLVLVGLSMLAGLQRYWSLDSVTDVVAECSARLIPLPGRGGRAMRRAVLRRLCGIVLVMPSGQKHAARNLLVRVAPSDEFSLRGGESLHTLAVDLQQVYESHARKSGWVVTIEPMVTVEVDVRLRSGWVRVQAVSGWGEGSGPLPRTRFDTDVDSALLGDFVSSVPAPPNSSEGMRAQGSPADRWRKRVASTVVLTERAPEERRNERHSFEPMGKAPVLGDETGVVHDGVVGRGDDVETHLDHARTSRRHAELSWNERGWQVRDLGSTNGTLINGIPIRTGTIFGTGDEVALLRPTDVITFGDGGPAYVVRIPEKAHVALTERASWSEQASAEGGR